MSRPSPAPGSLDIATVCDPNLLRLVTAHAQAVGVSNEQILFPLLSIVSACLESATVKLTDDWLESTSLWTAVIVRPGARRTAILDRLQRHLMIATEGTAILERPTIGPRLIREGSLVGEDKEEDFVTLHMVENIAGGCGSYTPKFCYEQTTGHGKIIAGYLPRCDATKLAAHNRRLFNRLLMFEAPEVNYKASEFRSPMSSDTPDMTAMLRVVLRAHQAAQYAYDLDERAREVFWEFYDECVCSQQDADDAAYSLHAKAASQAARLSVAFSCARQALLKVVDVSGETDNTWFHAVYGDDMSSAIATVRASLKLKLTATSQSRWRPNSIGFPASTIGKTKSFSSSNKRQRMSMENNTSTTTTGTGTTGGGGAGDRPRSSFDMSTSQALSASLQRTPTGGTGAGGGGGIGQQKERMWQQQVQRHQFTGGSGDNFTPTNQQGRKTILVSDTTSLGNGISGTGGTTNNGAGPTSMSKFFNDANALNQPGGSLANHGVGGVSGGGLGGGGTPGGGTGGGGTGSVSGAGSGSGGLYRSSWHVPLSPSNDDIIPRLQVDPIAYESLRGIYLDPQHDDFVVSYASKIKKFLEYPNAHKRHLMPPIDRLEMIRLDLHTRFPVLVAKVFMSQVALLGFGFMSPPPPHLQNRRSIVYEKTPFDSLTDQCRRLLNRLEISEATYSMGFVASSQALNLRGVDTLESIALAAGFATDGLTNGLGSSVFPGAGVKEESDHVTMICDDSLL